jgi:hypothetical protein
MKLLFLATLATFALCVVAPLAVVANDDPQDPMRCIMKFTIGLATVAPTVGQEVVLSFIRTSGATIQPWDSGFNCYLTVDATPVITTIPSGCKNIVATNTNNAM